MSTKAHKSFERTLERVDAMLEAHKIVTRQQGRPPRFLSDILRSTIILIIASLDSYLHDVIQERVYHYVSIRKGKNLHKKLLETFKDAVPYEKVFRVWFSARPSVHIATAVRKRNADRTFINPDKIEEALQIVGIDDIWVLAARKFRRRKDGLKTLFKAYADRRNKIVHEGDAFRVTRKKGELRSIRRPYVEQCYSDVKKFVDVVEKAI